MPCAPKPSNETARLGALVNAEILDTAAEADFDALVELAASILDVPISLVSLVDKDRQWFKAKVGITADETPRRDSFCAYAIHAKEVMVVEDATKDPRVCDNLLVTGAPHIRFYAGSPIYSYDGQPLGTLCVIDLKPRKITEAKIKALTTLANQVTKLIELRHQNRILQTAKHRAEKSHQNLQQLIQVISHDLRSPFNGLINLTAMLQEDRKDMPEEEISENLDILNHTTHHTFALLENLLVWSMSEADMVAFSPEAVHFHSILQAVRSIISPIIENKKQTLTIDTPSDLQLRVDARMIESILRNLLSNASKFTKNNGTITIKATVEGPSAEISIHDNGVGMDQDKILKILAKDNSESTIGTLGESGSGLGLKLIRSFLNKHDTELKIESTPGHGTIASFTLPLA